MEAARIVFYTAPGLKLGCIHMDSTSNVLACGRYRFNLPLEVLQLNDMWVERTKGTNPYQQVCASSPLLSSDSNIAGTEHRIF